MPRTNGLAADLDAVRGTARGEGVSLAVDLQRMLVGLELDDRVLARGPAGLAAEISPLSNEAGTNSLWQGMPTGCGAEVAAAVGDYLISIDGQAEQPAPEPPCTTADFDLSAGWTCA